MLHTNVLENRRLVTLSDAEIDAVSGGTEILDIDFDLGDVEGSVGVDLSTGDISGSLSTTQGNTTFTLEGGTANGGEVKATVTVRF